MGALPEDDSVTPTNTQTDSLGGLGALGGMGDMGGLTDAEKMLLQLCQEQRKTDVIVESPPKRSQRTGLETHPETMLPQLKHYRRSCRLLAKRAQRVLKQKKRLPKRPLPQRPLQRSAQGAQSKRAVRKLCARHEPSK